MTGRTASDAASVAAVNFGSLPTGVRQFAQGVSGLITGAGRTPGHGTFPLILLLVVVLFLFSQNRIDRRDPKLALAAVYADESLDFRPPSPGGAA